VAELPLGHRASYTTSTGSTPESQAFIESWFAKLKQRCVWREEFETLEQARAAIGAYVERYHHRPHQGLGAAASRAGGGGREPAHLEGTRPLQLDAPVRR
jgi:transposase InsO family protein